jgi:hypothetical protein
VLLVNSTGSSTRNSTGREGPPGQARFHPHPRFGRYTRTSSGSRRAPGGSGHDPEMGPLGGRGAFRGRYNLRGGLRTSPHPQRGASNGVEFSVADEADFAERFKGRLSEAQLKTLIR